MEVNDQGMDKIDPESPAHLLAAGVRDSRIFFLQLTGPWSEKVTVMFGGWELCSPDYTVRRTSYPCHVLELVVGGSGRVSLDGTSHRLETGVCFATGPKTACVIETDADTPLEKFFFALAGPGATQALKRAGLTPTNARMVAAPGEMRELAESLVREGRRHATHAPAVCTRLIEVMLLKLTDTPARPDGLATDSTARANFEHCRALIDRHAAEWRGLSEVAAAAGIDASSVCRLFRRFLGVSPHRYLRRRKMALAAAWLVERGGRVQDAAAQVGMSDVFHFSRAFRAVHGVPPSTLLAAKR